MPLCIARPVDDTDRCVINYNNHNIHNNYKVVPVCTDGLQCELFCEILH